jgi:ribonucleoside-diphosphate reductase alpha chain
MKLRKLDTWWLPPLYSIKKNLTQLACVISKNTTQRQRRTLHLATPVLAGLGTPTKQFSSCVLIRSDDDLDSIFASGEMMAKYASKRAGIGLEIGRLRPLGSPIRGGEIMHTGMIPFLKKWFGDLRSCSQGGIRNASATVFYPIWHLQFDDLIVLKNNQGTEETRVRHMDYGVVLSAFFWKRFKNKENITFFDPNQVPDLYEAF